MQHTRKGNYWLATVYATVFALLLYVTTISSVQMSMFKLVVIILQILKNLLAHFNAEENRLQTADHECKYLDTTVYLGVMLYSQLQGMLRPKILFQSGTRMQGT